MTLLMAACNIHVLHLVCRVEVGDEVICNLTETWTPGRRRRGLDPFPAAGAYNGRFRDIRADTRPTTPGAPARVPPAPSPSILAHAFASHWLVNKFSMNL